MYKKIISAILLLVLFANCSSLGRNGKHLYTSFFAEQGILYFIKPIEMVGNQEKSLLDFTFKSKQTLEGLTRVNISFYTSTPIHEITSIQFVIKGKNYPMTNGNFMFIERKKHNFESRFSFEIETNYLKEIFTSNDWELNFTENNKTHTFKTTSLTNKKINLLRDNLFSIFQ